MCKISVVTSIYNGEKYIGETIESILHQTFTDWEYILIDNASTDASAEIIENYVKKDSRIRFYRNKENMGLSVNLNKGLALARGKYIARTDADDLSYPHRLEKQFQYMEAHPEIALLGCVADVLKGNQRIQSTPLVTASDFQETRLMLPFWNVIVASSVFVRRDFVKEKNIRFRPYQYAQDYSFLLDVLRAGEIVLIPDHLVTYRLSSVQFSHVIPLALKEKERIIIQMEYLSAIPAECREIFKLAILGRLCSVSDIEKFDRAIGLYAEYCGLTKTRAYCFHQIYRTLYTWQVGSWGLLRGYISSPFREGKWLFAHEGLSVLKQCILRKDYYGLSNITKDMKNITGD